MSCAAPGEQRDESLLSCGPLLHVCGSPGSLRLRDRGDALTTLLACINVRIVSGPQYYDGANRHLIQYRPRDSCALLRAAAFLWPIGLYMKTPRKPT